MDVINELLNAYEQLKIDYMKMTYYDKDRKYPVIIISALLDDGLVHEKIFTSSNDKEEYKNSLYIKTVYDTFDEYINTMDEIYSEKYIDYCIEKVTFSESGKMVREVIK